MTRLKSRQLENHTTYCIWNAVTHTSAEAAIHNNPQQKLQVYLQSTANAQSLAVSLDSRARLADLNQLLSRVCGINASNHEFVLRMFLCLCVSLFFVFVEVHSSHLEFGPLSMKIIQHAAFG